MTHFLTIGHSNHDVDKFSRFLISRGVTDLIDVRSKPQSRFNPSFNMERFHAHLAARGITYHFRGKELGGYSAPDEAMAVSIDRLVAFYTRRPKAVPVIMCSEGVACECHRHHWMTRYMLRNTGATATNIHPDKPDEDPTKVPFEDGFNATELPWPIFRPWRVEGRTVPARVSMIGYPTEEAAREAVKKACPVQASAVNVFQVK